MPNLLRMMAWVLVGFLLFDLAGVALSFVIDLVVVLHRRWEGSSPLAYVIWFVVGVFCAVFIYRPTRDGAYDSPPGRQAGTQLVLITAVIAVLLGVLASFVWSGSGAGEAMAPDHRGVTITYLVTVVACVALARFVLFRGETPQERNDSIGESVRRRSRRKALLPPDKTERRATDEGGTEDQELFSPAGFWQTLGYLIGVPVLLFLDASYFLLGPFDYFDRWTGPILASALFGGLSWGFAAARWRSPRMGLWLLHTPLLCGTVFYFFALLAEALLVGVGLSADAAAIVSLIGFWIGFLLGCVALVGAASDWFGRAKPAPRADPS